MAKIICFLIVCCLYAEEQPLCTLTTHSQSLSPEQLKQLTHIGISLTFNDPFCQKPKPPKHAGAQFLFHKAKIVRKWLHLSPLRPNNRVLLDNGRPSLSEGSFESL